VIKTIIGLFLFLNSLLGYGFYENTAFGDFLAQSELLGFGFLLVNFVVSHVLIMFLRVPALEWLSYFVLIALFALFVFCVCILIPYYLIFELLGWSGLFAMTIFFLGAVTLLATFIGPLMKSFLDETKQLIDAFFEGLKRGAVENMINKNKSNAK